MVENDHSPIWLSAGYRPRPSVAACLARSILVAPPDPSTCACMEPEISMTASILDGSLLTCTLRIASSTAAVDGNGAVTITTGFMPLAVDDPWAGAPSGARNPAPCSACRPSAPTSNPTRSFATATTAASVDMVTAG